MNAEKILDIFRQEALEHKRQEKAQKERDYKQFVNDGFRYRKRSVSHLRPRKGGGRVV